MAATNPWMSLWLAAAMRLFHVDRTRPLGTLILPPHVRLLITDIRGRRQNTHATPILWDAQVPAGHHNATAVHLSHPEASIGEVVLVLDLPQSGAQGAMEDSGALRSITYLTRTTSWQLGWQTTQRIQPDGMDHGWINRPPSGGQPGPMGC